MVKLYAPMFSLGASGTVGKAVTFSGWKGRAYARQRVVPANPKSALQVSVRAMMRFLSQAWASVGSTPQGSWADRAAAGNYSNFNAFIARNMARWREFQAPGQTDPVAESGTLPTATFDSATGGVRSMDLEWDITSLDDVWGVILFRSDSTGFSTALSNAVRVIPVDATGSLIYTDSNLTPGTYYYNSRFFTKEGSLGPEEGEQSGTAT